MSVSSEGVSSEDVSSAGVSSEWVSRVVLVRVGGREGGNSEWEVVRVVSGRVRSEGCGGRVGG